MHNGPYSSSSSAGCRSSASRGERSKLESMSCKSRSRCQWKGHRDKASAALPRTAGADVRADVKVSADPLGKAGTLAGEGGGSEKSSVKS